MDKLLTVADIMARYSCSAPTARKLMRQMIHFEANGLKVWQADVEAWERERTVYPMEQRRAARPRHTQKTACGLIPYRKY